MSPNPSPRAGSLLSTVRLLSQLGATIEWICREFDLTLGQYRILTYILEGSPRPSDLAAALFITRSTLTESTQGLERRGLISRVRTADDGRAVTLHLTTRGADTLNAVEQRLKEFIRTIARDVGLPMFRATVEGLRAPLHQELQGRKQP